MSRQRFARRSVVRKSPNHASALRLKDLKIGRKVHIVNLLGAYDIDGTIVSESYMGYAGGDKPLFEGEPKTLIINIRHDDGTIGSYDLYALGVIVSDKGLWSPFGFVMDFKKKHLVDKYLGPRSAVEQVDDAELHMHFEASWDNYLATDAFDHELPEPDVQSEPGAIFKPVEGLEAWEVELLEQGR